MRHAIGRLCDRPSRCKSCFSSSLKAIPVSTAALRAVTPKAAPALAMTVSSIAAPRRIERRAAISSDLPEAVHKVSSHIRLIDQISNAETSRLHFNYKSHRRLEHRGRRGGFRRLQRVETAIATRENGRIPRIERYGLPCSELQAVLAVDGEHYRRLIAQRDCRA